jgi:hypothetical protein
LCLKGGREMVIINNISEQEWSLILSALKSEVSNGWMNEIFPKRIESTKKLIEKIEGK